MHESNGALNMFSSNDLSILQKVYQKKKDFEKFILRHFQRKSNFVPFLNTKNI